MGERTASNLELVGGRLCLDFANTVSTRLEALRREYLTTYGELLSWSRHASILSDGEAWALLDRAARNPVAAAAALERAIALREIIYRTFSAIAGGRGPEKADVDELNRALHRALPHLEITRSPHGFVWAWIPDEDGLDSILRPIVHSAADLLTSDILGRVRECAREGCDWLFVDLSKNQSRRWCSMNACGSREKARQYYRRKKSMSPGVPAEEVPETGDAKRRRLAQSI